MRRWTLIAIIVLLLTLVAVAIYQLVLAGGERRFPGPTSPPSASP